MASKAVSPKRSMFKKTRLDNARPRRRGVNLQAGGVLLSLCGVLACNYLGLGLGRAVCHGLLVASLGAPLSRSSSRRIRAS